MCYLVEPLRVTSYPANRIECSKFYPVLIEIFSLFIIAIYRKIISLYYLTKPMYDN